MLDTSTDPQVGYRPPGSLDVSTALGRYDGEFSRRHAAHLLRRAGFGGTPADIETAVAGGMARAVDALLHPTRADETLGDYPDTALLTDPKTRNFTAQIWWLDRMLRTQRPFVEKMALFWHGHFATSIRKVPAALMVGQIDLFRLYGMGNFRTLLRSVSRDPAMLVWLDNRYNNKSHPNENYAREVMELFALGLGNYTEDDVRSAARAFTGWTLDKNLAFIYRDGQHDDGEKTFLGRSGKLSGDDVLNAIVQQPIHQRFICRKLLEYFVYSDPEPTLVDALSQTYALSGFDIARTVGTIVRSNVFYSARAYRALPKSPIEFTIGLLRYMNVRAVPRDTVSWLQRMGQEPLAPPSVKGWDGGPAWINTATLLARFNYVNRVVKAAPPRATAPPTASGMSTSAGARGSAAAGAPSPSARAAVRATPTATAAATAAKATASVTATTTTTTTMMAPTDARTPAAAPVDLATYPALTPDAIVQEAGGIDARRVLATLARDAVQDDVTSDVRRMLLDYLQSTTAPVPVPLGPENYQEKIRGALALVLQLPANQLN